MTAKCLLCGDDIILLCEGYCELSVNRYVCTKCVGEVRAEETRRLLEKKLAERIPDAVRAAENLHKAIKKYGLNVGETNVKD